MQGEYTRLLLLSLSLLSLAYSLACLLVLGIKKSRLEKRKSPTDSFAATFFFFFFTASIQIHYRTVFWLTHLLQFLVVHYTSTMIS